MDTAKLYDPDTGTFSETARWRPGARTPRPRSCRREGASGWGSAVGPSVHVEARRTLRPGNGTFSSLRDGAASDAPHGDAAPVGAGAGGGATTPPARVATPPRPSSTTGNGHLRGHGLAGDGAVGSRGHAAPVGAVLVRGLTISSAPLPQPSCTTPTPAPSRHGLDGGGSGWSTATLLTSGSAVVGGGNLAELYDPTKET